tara:strand:- start:1928 stop:2614 length:687 start_codon:yes stop_codon:yes gene_type:complete
MNNEISNLLSSENINVSFDNFLIAIFLSILLGFLVREFYIRFSTTLSNKVEFSKTFVILAATTTIVITIVKSSLALSLGLVGALSIVRFRAAIKEPEELVYLFLLIAIGLGCGAGQFFITVIGVSIILILIFLYSKVESRKKIKNLDKLSLSIICNYKTKEEEIDKFKNTLLEKADFVKLISLVKSENNTTINFQIQLKEFNDLNKIINLVQKENIKVVVAQNDVITT